MDKNTKTFLRIGKVEGYSYLILLFIAMPIKYLFDLPIAVRVVGMAHGVLFVWFMFTILVILLEKKINFLQAVKAFVLSLIPFGTFYLKSQVLEK